MATNQYPNIKAYRRLLWLQALEGISVKILQYGKRTIWIL